MSEEKLKGGDDKMQHDVNCQCGKCQNRTVVQSRPETSTDGVRAKPPPESETAEVNDNIKICDEFNHVTHQYVSVSFARSLERQRDELKMSKEAIEDSLIDSLIMVLKEKGVDITWCDGDDDVVTILSDAIKTCFENGHRSLKHRIEILVGENEKLVKDKERLDFLQKQTCDDNESGWIARVSSTGRGYRLHESSEGKTKDVRHAIDAAISHAIEKEKK